MSSDDLAAIRSKRMAELKTGNATSSNNDNEKANEQQELMKNTILKQALEQAALARLNNLLVAKPDKGRMVENMIFQMARGGQIPGKLSDDDLKKMLDRISECTQKTTTVKFELPLIRILNKLFPIWTIKFVVRKFYDDIFLCCCFFSML